MLARWRSKPINYRFRERQPITERLQSISLKSHLRKNVRGTSYKNVIILAATTKALFCLTVTRLVISIA